VQKNRPQTGSGGIFPEHGFRLPISRQWLCGVHESATGKNTTAQEESTLAETTSLSACRALPLLSPLVVEQI
jgi:hypothetical protein